MTILLLSFNELAVADGNSSYFSSHSPQAPPRLKLKLEKLKRPQEPWYKRFWKWLKGKRFFWFALIIGAAKLIKETVINDYKKTKKNNNK